MQGKAGISWEMMFLGVDTVMTLHRSLRRNRKVTYRIRLGVEWTEIRNDWSWVDNTTTYPLSIGLLMTIPTPPGLPPGIQSLPSSTVRDYSKDWSFHVLPKTYS